MNPLNYLLVSVNVRIGDYDTDDAVLLKTRALDLNKRVDRVAKDWYADLEWDDDFDGFTNGEIAVTASHRVVTLEDFEVLKKFFKVL